MSDSPARLPLRGPWLWVSLSLIALVGGVVGALLSHAFWSGPDLSAAACTASSVADQVLPSMVTIDVGRTATTPAGSGSGEFIRAGGYILTNNHVVASAATGAGLQVTLADGQTQPATLVGRDPLTDLAVIKAAEAESATVITLGDSSTIDVGQPVVVVGAPLGLSNSVTSGIVSALGRRVQVPGQGGSSALLVDAVQTDAAINPGNSGGAMVDCRGQLIGVPTAGAQVPGASGGNIGLGFAIPVNLATAVAEEIIATGTVTHASFGLAVVPISGPAAQRAGVSEGLGVTAVQAGGPAAAAGLRPGDVITAIDGQPARSPDQLTALTITKKAGETVELTYERDGHSHTTTVTLGRQQPTGSPGTF